MSSLAPVPVAVQRELARLADSGLVTGRSIGRRRHCQANTEAPIFDELRGIILETVGLAVRVNAMNPKLHERFLSKCFTG